MRRQVFGCAATAIAALVLAATIEAPAQQGGKPNSNVIRNRVFRLKNFDPNRAVEILEELLTEPVDVFIPTPNSGKRRGNQPDGPPYIRDPLPGTGAGPGSGPSAGASTPFGGTGANPGGQGAADQLPAPSQPGAVIPYPRLPPPPGGLGSGQPSGIPAPGPSPMAPTLPRPPGTPGTGYAGPFGGSNAPAPPIGPPERYRVAVDPKSKTILMRGLEPDVLAAAELMTVLDLPEDQPIPKLTHIRAFRLKQADPKKVAEQMEGLGTAARVVAVPELSLVVAYGPDQELKDIAEAIGALDAVDPDQPDADKPKGSSESARSNRKPPQPEEEDGKRPKNEGPTYRDRDR
ncbi:MAG: hypothetical protein NZM31_15600 [Gemmatales bacterium]|nr:hypothetical protein [Gemmatales bacterium]MDW8388422.1 hypothetical protein [Gemmatales bacterium]